MLKKLPSCLTIQEIHTFLKKNVCEGVKPLYAEVREGAFPFLYT